MALTTQERKQIETTLGRSPSAIEERVLTCLWSEHCSYRHSRAFLRRLAETYAFGALGAGGNAGGVALPSGRQIFFKIESHNHPSYVEPKEGAATGVGGIIRDVVAMGARPMMIGDVLSFGDPTSDPYMQRLVAGVTSGISAYGNAIGIPNVGGDTQFDACYQGNILVNVFALGVRDEDDAIDARISKDMLHEGVDIHLFGSKTGRDGIGGAAMASETLTLGGADHKRPQVQISDPYMGKRILEISLALAKCRWILALQDCGAAGMAGAILELCLQNQCGGDVFLDHVPLRDTTMLADEIFVSESQERMIAIASVHHRERICALCAKWDVPHAVIGRLDCTPRLNIWHRQQKLAILDPHFVCEGHRPLYNHIQPRHPDQPRHPERSEGSRQDKSCSLTDWAYAWVGSLRGCDRSWIFHQYDQHVGGRTIREPSLGSVGIHVVALPLLGDTLDAEIIGVRLTQSPAWTVHHPRIGAWHQVRESVRYLRAVGLVPVGITNGLNFANPENQDVQDALDETVLGLTEAAVHYRLPVVSGNVSLYNATGTNGIRPTLALGVVGVGNASSRLPPHPMHYPETFSVWQVQDFLDSFDQQEQWDTELSKLWGTFPLVHVCFSDLKPIWGGFLAWLMRHGPMSGELRYQDAHTLLTIGNAVAWVIVPHGTPIPNTSLKITEVGHLARNTSQPLTITSPNASEILDWSRLHATYFHTLPKSACLRHP